MASNESVIALFDTEVFVKGSSEHGLPVVTRTFVERLGSRWAVKSNSYFINRTTAWDGSPNTRPAGSVRGCSEKYPFILSTHGTKRNAVAALARATP